MAVHRISGVNGGDGDAAVLAVNQRWWDEIWRDGNLDAIDELFTDPFTRHMGSGTVLSRAETVIEDRVVDGDKVWTRATSKGINRETGERSVVTWLMIQRVEDGRIAEQWVASFLGVDWTT